MAKHHVKQPRGAYDFIDQPVASFFKSNRRVFDKAILVKKRTKQSIKMVAWATAVSSQKLLKISVMVRPINNIRNSKYELIKPMCAIVEYDNDRSDVVTATCYDAEGLFGYGVTELDAVDELCKSIVEVYEDLQITPEEGMGPAAKTLKGYLTEVIRKRNAA